MIYSLENDLKGDQIGTLASFLFAAGNETHSLEKLTHGYCGNMLASFEGNCKELMPPLLGRRDISTALALKRKVEKMWRGMMGQKNRSDPNSVSDLISAASNKNWDNFCEIWTDGWYSERIYNMEDEEVYEGEDLKEQYTKWKKNWFENNEKNKSKDEL